MISSKINNFIAFTIFQFFFYNLCLSLSLIWQVVSNSFFTLMTKPYECSLPSMIINSKGAKNKVYLYYGIDAAKPSGVLFMDFFFFFLKRFN